EARQREAKPGSVLLELTRVSGRGAGALGEVLQPPRQLSEGRGGRAAEIAKVAPGANPGAYRAHEPPRGRDDGDRERDPEDHEHGADASRAILPAAPRGGAVR